MENGMPYVLRKQGMYYAHNNCGYVHNVLMAEIYTKDYAEAYAGRHEEIQAIPVISCISNAEEIQEYIERLQVMRDAILSTS